MNLAIHDPQAPAVQDSPDFRRILALPRRVLPERVAVPDLRTDRGRAEQHDLLGVQTVALAELAQCRGLFGAMPVGSGKTLFTMLAAWATGAKRPYLFVPANLITKTRREFARLAHFWRQPQPMPVIESYSKLTQEGNVNYLFDVQPDLLLFDECKQLRRIDDGSAPVRVDRFVKAVRAAEVERGLRFGDLVVVAAVDGTIGRGDLRDFAHILRWCLGSGAPVPLGEGALWQWASATADDRKVQVRWLPGVLRQFANGSSDIDAVRAGLARRMAETPGVIMYDGDSCDQPMRVDFVRPPPDPALDERFYQFRKTSRTVNDEILSDGIAIYKYVSAVGCGYEPLWDPPAPKPWLEKRNAWSKFCRDRIDESRHSPHPLDTEKAVKTAYPHEETLREWRAIEKSFTPNPVASWLSAGTVYAVRDLVQALEAGCWSDPCTDPNMTLRGKPRKVLVWTWHRPVAQALTTVTQLPYYGADGKRYDANLRAYKDGIDDVVYAPDGSPTKSLILSMQANRVGRNLQAYHVAVVVGWEAASDLAEQFFGRMHRQLQTQPVRIIIVRTSGETIDAFAKGWDEASVVQKMQMHTQKILRAQVIAPEYDSTDRTPRWVTKNKI